jgi:rod shape-determining protein MreC
MKKKKFNDSMKSKYLLVVITVLCLILIALSFVTDTTTGPFRYVASYVITPVQKGLNEVGNWITDKGAYLQSSTDLVAENEELQEQVDALTAENSRLLLEQEELERLRALYDLDQQYEDYEKVGARIIAKDTGNWFSVFTIDKGSEDGIKVNMNVITEGGLVGIVTETGKNWSTVRSIIDDNSNVSATVTSTSDNCIIAGDLRLIDEGKINLVKLTDSSDKVSVGDKVVTSDVSDRYLPGILIGYISEIAMDSNNLTKSGTITPVVDFAHLHEVLVITQLKDTDDAKESLDAQSDTENSVTADTSVIDETEGATSASADE